MSVAKKTMSSPSNVVMLLCCDMRCGITWSIGPCHLQLVPGIWQTINEWMNQWGVHRITYLDMDICTVYEYRLPRGLVYLGKGAEFCSQESSIYKENRRSKPLFPSADFGYSTWSGLDTLDMWLSFCDRSGKRDGHSDIAKLEVKCIRNKRDIQTVRPTRNLIFCQTDLNPFMSVWWINFGQVLSIK